MGRNGFRRISLITLAAAVWFGGSAKADTSPTITTQPQSQTVPAGTHATFSITVAGTAPTTCQWRFKGTNLFDGGRISGATAAILTISNTRAADAGNYAVVISNEAGAVTSQSAALTVLAPPMITTQPQKTTVTAGTGATFAVCAAGNAPLSYQWRFNGTDLFDGERIRGATSVFLTISNVQTSDAGTYTVVVSNALGTAVSQPVTLAVATDPAGIKLIKRGAWPGHMRGGGNYGQHEFIFGKYAYRVSPASYDQPALLEIVDVSDPVHPQWTSEYTSTGVFTQVAVSGDYAYLVQAGPGLEILDVSDPMHPRKIGSYATTTGGYSVAVRSNVVYIGSPSPMGDLEIVDASDPVHPRRLGGIASLDIVRHIVVNGDYAYVASESNGLLIIDVANPANPKQVGQYLPPRQEIRHVSISGPHAYVTDGNGVQVLDVSNPAAPKLIGYETGYWVGTMDVKGHYLYAAVGIDGLRVVDMTNPADPRLAGGLGISGYSTAVSVSGNYAYILNLQDNIIHVIDVSDPERPSEVGVSGYDISGSAQDLFIGGKNAYLADGLSGLQVIDLGDSANPKWMGGYDTGDDGAGMASDVIGSGNYLYVSDYKNFSAPLQVLDVSVPAQPVRVGKPKLEIWRARGVFTTGKYAYLVSHLGGGGLDVFDVSNPSSPIPLSHFNDGDDDWWDVYVQGNYAYAACGAAGLKVIDVSIPSSPKKVGSYSTTSYTQSVFVSGKHAYLAYGLNGLVVLDVSDPAHPQRVGGYLPSEKSVTDGTHAILVGYVGAYGAVGVWVSGNYAFLTVQFLGLIVVNVSDPTNPALVAGTAIPGAYRAAVHGNYAYVSAGGNGVQVLEIARKGAPEIRQPPSSQAVMSGSNAVMKVSAEGSAPLSYQWQFEGQDMPGATNATLELSNVQLMNVGTYRVFVSNLIETVGSQNATLTLLEAPVITIPPQGQTGTAGRSATFSVTATGSLPLRYQWQRNGTNLLSGGRINGATTASLRMENIQRDDGGDYTVLVTNSLGAAMSRPVKLAVSELRVIANQPQSQTVLRGSNVSFSVTTSNVASLNFQWRFNGVNLTESGRISGINTATLRIVNAQPSDEGSYDVVLSNAGGIETSDAANLTVVVPPTIASQPQSRTVVAGTGVSFSVSVNGTAPLSYQWRKDGVDFPGATNASHSIANVQANDAGNYTVVVTNSAGSVTSAVAVLSVLVPPVITAQPQGLSVVLGSNATFRVTATGTAPLSYQWHKDGDALSDGGRVSGAGAATLTITGIQVGDAGNYTVVVSNAVGSATSPAAALVVLVPPAITGQPQGQSVALGSNVTFGVTAGGTGPLFYQWRKDGVTLSNGGRISGATEGGLRIADCGLADAGNYTVVVTSAAGSATSQVAVLAVVEPPLITAQPQGLSVVLGSNAIFRVTASVTTSLSYQWRKDGAVLADGGRISGATQWELRIADCGLADAGNYTVVITNAAGSATSQAAALVVLVPPQISAQPQSQAAMAGASVSFSVTASGTAPLFYQWYKNAAAISAATNSSFIIDNSSLGDAGAYTVVVTDTVGSVTSQVAVLAVIVPPLITAQPQGLSVVLGSNATFQVTASGTTPLSYQWRKEWAALSEGGRISGARTATLRITGVLATDAGNYMVVVTNSVGSATSNPAQLKLAPPLITAQPASQKVLVSSDVLFSVKAKGVPPFTYRWFKEGWPIVEAGRFSGVATAQLMIFSAELADSGDYTVEVGNRDGNTLSETARLSVVREMLVAWGENGAGQCNLPEGLSNVVAVAAGFDNSLALTAEGRVIAWGNNANGQTNVPSDLRDVVAISLPVTDAASICHGLALRRDGTVTSWPKVTGPFGNSTWPDGLTGAVAIAANWNFDTALLRDGTVAWWGSENVDGSPASLTDAVAIAGGPHYTLALRRDGTVVGWGQGPAVPDLRDIVAIAAGGTHCLALRTDGRVMAWGDAGGGRLEVPADLSEVVAISAGQNYSLALKADGGVVTWGYQAPPVPSGLSDAVAIAAGRRHSLALQRRGPPVLISVLPAAPRVVVGKPLTLWASAVGNAPLTYQWRKEDMDLGDDGRISGAGTPQLMIAATTAEDAGNYTVMVANGWGAQTSSTNRVVVVSPPVVTRSPPAQAVAAGATITLEVMVVGTPPFTYHWRKDNAAVAGATNSTLVLANFSASLAGTYEVVVSNEAGSQGSSPARVTLLLAPVITKPPISQRVALGSDAFFSVAAEGMAPLSYQWRHNGLPVSGATNANLQLSGVQEQDAGSYLVVVSNPGGSVFSGAATLTVLLPPSVVTAPRSQVVLAGGNTSFAVTVLNPATVSFQWQFQGVDLAGATNATLSLRNLQSSQAGDYTVVAAREGLQAYRTAQLTVVQPILEMTPTNGVVARGQDVSLRVLASGTHPVRYQWLFNGAPLGAPNAAVLHLTNVQPAVAGQYSVTVSNDWTAVTTQPALLVVGWPPVIEAAPANRVVRSGVSVIMRVTASGEAPLAYQWRRNNVPLDGATNDVLQLQSVRLDQSGDYTVVVTNLWGAVTNDPPAVLSVLDPPIILKQPQSQTLTEGSALVLTATITGSAPFDYQWRKDGARIPGATNATLDLTPAKVWQSGQYQVIVSNLVGSATSATATVLVNPAPVGSPPVISTQPQSQTNVAGANLTLTVIATGSTPLAYQWYFNESNLANGTTAALRFQPLALTNAGQYFCIVTNAYGSATSHVATVTVTNLPANLLPLVSITSPTNGAVFTPATNIQLAATAVDSDGRVERVEFFADTNLLGTITNASYRLVWSNVSVGVYTLRARAYDNLGSNTLSAPVTVSVLLPGGPAVFQLNQSVSEVSESATQVVVRVLKTTGGAGVVNYATKEGTAKAVNNEGYGDYQTLSGSLVFGPLDTEKTVAISMINDLGAEGNQELYLELSLTGDGSQLGSPALATIRILDDEPSASLGSALEVRTPNAWAALGRVRMHLEPVSAGGQWRFAWETGWRANDTEAAGLEPGDYTALFQSLTGWIGPAPDTFQLAAGARVGRTNSYIAFGQPVTGSLVGQLQPVGGRWRLQGVPPWIDSGTVADNLPEGEQVIEFEPIHGRVTPAPARVAVTGGALTSFSVYYPPVQNWGLSTPAEPTVVPLGSLLAQQNPYACLGELWTAAGYSSGYVVKERVVLTAAHALFNEADLVFADEALWFFQRHKDEHEPLPQQARGWYIFSGYATARSNSPPGQSSVEAYNLDVAAVYFLAPAGRGGYGGYVVSDGAKNWLTGPENKKLLGYPVSGKDGLMPGKLYTTVESPLSFEPVSQGVYGSAGFRSYPGNSGGPLCVLHTNGYYYPAAVYLGESGPKSIVRVIDTNVVDLINRAEVTANTGDNYTGGGVITVMAGTAGTGTRAYVKVRLGPAGAVAAGAAWRLQGETNWLTATNMVRSVAQGGSVALEFREMAGWGRPTNRSVTLVLGQTAVIDGNYVRLGPGLSAPTRISNGVFAFGLSGQAGMVYVLEASTNLAQTHWLILATNTMGASSVWQFTDPASTNLPSRYYRAKEKQ